MGKYIKEIDQLYEALGGLFGGLDAYPPIKQAVLDAKLTLAIHCTDPAGFMVIDSTAGDIKFFAGGCPPEVTPKAHLKMAADTGHLFWLGKVNFMLAMAKREIKSEGDLRAVLKLVPVLGPLFKAYAEVLKAKGMTDLLA